MSTRGIALACLAGMLGLSHTATADLRSSTSNTPAPLAPGRNLLAAAVYNDAPGSTDLTLIVQIKVDGKIVLDEGQPCRAIIPVRDIPNDDDPTDWTKPQFDDSEWKAAEYGVGYGDDDDNADIGDAEHAAVYTRAVFEVANPSATSVLVVGADFDDGCVIWINGVEVAREAETDIPKLPEWDSWTARGSGHTHEASKTDPPRYETIELPVKVIPALTIAHSAPARRSVQRSNGSSADLEWLRGEVGDGALAHHADGRIYLTELSTAETAHVGNGDQPEFSPDGAKLAWIDGRAAKGRLRKGDTSVHVIAQNVERSGGVHWLSNGEVALLLRKGSSGPKWFRVLLAGGDMAEIPELTALGTGGNECDVKLGADGVWSYVAKHTWATSDGRRGKVAGTCSVSLSPDGKSVTSLHGDHKRCSIEAIRPGGVERTVRWTYRGGFDNHRWASSDSRYIVVADEVDQDSKGACYPVVMTADGSRRARVASKGFARHGVYGDFVVGDGVGKGWLGSADVASGQGG